MKNQFYGDINDYLKYGLLRCFSDADLRIGICWMLTPNDGRSDGRKIGYLLDAKKWRSHDPFLFDHLVEAIQKGFRHVRHVEKSGIVTNTSFCSEHAPDHQPARKKWLVRALRKLKEADLIFFDPDNGIEVKSTPAGKRGSCKYLYWNEIEMAWSQKSSLLIFQHFPREKREPYIARRAYQLQSRLPDAVVIPLITSNVLYLLAYQQQHKSKVNIALKVMNKRWGEKIRIP